MLNDQRVDRSKFEFASLDASGDQREYWRSRTIEERLEAAELIRQSVYGYDPETARMQKVLEVVPCLWA